MTTGFDDAIAKHEGEVEDIEKLRSQLEALSEWAREEREEGDLMHSASDILAGITALVHEEPLPKDAPSGYTIEEHKAQQHTFLLYPHHVGWCTACGLMARGHRPRRYLIPGKTGETTTLPLCPGKPLTYQPPSET